ncbi:MAG: hypothetical protein QF704_14085, partial [Anaerolineales bacterium]|nr:hypothetical protein [Anaerolineales bacterium]
TFAAQTCTAAGLALLDDADASAQRTTLGLGDVSTLSIGIGDGNVLTANNAVADNDWLRIDGTEVEGRTDAEIKADLSLEIGTDVQAYDAQLADVAGLAVTNGGFIVGDGSNFVLETGATARTSIGLGTADNVEFEDTQVDSLGVGTAASSTTGEIKATSLDISGDADIDGTLETDNLTVGGSQGSDGQVLTSTGTGVAWEAAAGGGISHDGSTADGVLTYKDADEATVESNLTFDGTDLAIAATGKIYLDGGGGGGDTYIKEHAVGNIMQFFANGANIANISDGGLYVGATKKLWLDGGGDTYIQEISANVLGFFSEGNEGMRLTKNGDGDYPMLAIGSTNSGCALSVYNDSNGSEFIAEFENPYTHENRKGIKLKHGCTHGNCGHTNYVMMFQRGDGTTQGT